MTYRVPIVVLATLLISITINAGEVTFFDGDFVPGDWSATIAVMDDPSNPTPGPGTATAALSQATSGGNPGNYRKIEKTNRRGDIVAIFDLNINRYDPQLGGSVESVQFQWDGSASGAFDVATPFVPILQQGGNLFFSLAGIVTVDNDPVWQPFVSGELTASDFDTNAFAIFGLAAPDGVTPDFSATADSIGFGYATLGSTLGSDPLFIVNGIDNFSATFTTASVPEPGCVALLATIVLLPQRRRRR